METPSLLASWEYLAALCPPGELLPVDGCQQGVLVNNGGSDQLPRSCQVGGLANPYTEMLHVMTHTECGKQYSQESHC